MVDKGIEKLIRRELAGFGGYAASKSPQTLEGKVDIPEEDIIKLDANENPYGCSPRVTHALADYTDINIYPDSWQIQLRHQLQGYIGVDMSHIVASAGSDQLIDLIMRLFLEPGDEVINCVPTFAMFRFFTDLCGGKVIEVKRDDNFTVDVAAVEKAITNKTKLIMLATPNNPTGTITPHGDILKILDTGVPVVVDEAYYEFTEETVAPLIGRYKNLMVLRTFSKWAGLAGLRVGYGMFPVKIADYLLRIKEPYCVNAAALVAVKESLEDVNYLMANVKTIIAERERLFSSLEAMEWLKPYPSQANFILCSVLRGSARELQQKLEERGILVRYFDQPLLEDSVRISIGRPEENDILVETLNELGEELYD
ncbi:MAG TPA: histidinol-phosphate transaminase [Dehalococcoidia bacterium]|nr:histidinol-phosphate transaminase [Dehalococcoidia bacterium]